MKFSKTKMMARIEKEGLMHLLDDECKKLMDDLDGKEAVKNDFKALVYGQEEYMVRLNDRWYPVNKLDCE